MSKDLVVDIDGIKVSVTGHRKLVICIGIPVGDSITPAFFKTMLLRMEEWSQIFDIVPVIETSIPIDEARNNIAKVAIDNKCDYIFFIDSDTLIQRGQLEQLLSYDKDAITGISYMRVLPYYSLIRKKVGYRLYSPIEPIPSDEKLIKIDGAGFGCFLVKTSVFDKIKYPWFRFHFYQYKDQWRHIGEDLFFCEQLQDAKIDIYCDTNIQCTHIGTDVTTYMADRYKDLRISMLDENRMSKEELSEFTGASLEDVTDKCIIIKELITKQYKRFILDIGEDPKKFYKENKDYIFELTNWHIQGRIMFDIDLVKNIRNRYPNAKNILDYGSGCGQNAIDLSKAGYDVSMADYDGYTSQFARFRVKKRGLDIKFYDIESPINDKFDIIIVCDVLDHIPDNQFKDTINRLKSLKKEGGKILVTTSFGSQNGAYPMRYESSPEKIELINRLTEEILGEESK